MVPGLSAELFIESFLRKRWLQVETLWLWLADTIKRMMASAYNLAPRQCDTTSHCVRSLHTLLKTSRCSYLVLFFSLVV